MRMRTLGAAYAEIKVADPDTSLTKYALRQKVLSGEIPTVTVGRKRLIDVDRLGEYLNGTAHKHPAPPFGTLRRVEQIRR